MRSKTILRAVLGASLAAALLSPALAADNEIRLAQQFSMGYLQLNVMQHEKLIEKQAKALGIPDAKVSWFKFNGPTAVNEALISGNVDIGSGGVRGADQGDDAAAVRPQDRHRAGRAADRRGAGTDA